MALVLALVILALLIGGVGLAVEGLMWLLIIAAAVIVVSAVLGFTRRSI